ncbi:MAG: sialidase family protein [Candidatus Micrarchaeaceae archaeon]
MAVTNTKICLGENRTTFYACVIEDALPKVFKSTDSGINWSYLCQITDAYNWGTLDAIVYNPTANALNIAFKSDTTVRVYNVDLSDNSVTKKYETSVAAVESKIELAIVKLALSTVTLMTFVAYYNSQQTQCVMFYRTEDNWNNVTFVYYNLGIWYSMATGFVSRIVRTLNNSLITGFTVKTDTGYRIGVLRSTNFGVNWTPTIFQTSTSYSPINIAQLENESIIACCGNSRVYKSTNDGVDWTYDNVTLPATSVRLYAFRNTLVMIGNDNSVYKSEDEGLSWFSIGSIPNYSDSCPIPM